MVESGLRQAYLRTTYWVDAKPQPIAVRIGAHQPELDRLLSGFGARRWAFISAWNPRSMRVATWRNARRHRELIRTLKHQGLRWLPGIGEGDDPSWAPEPSVLVVGMSAPQARRVGRRFGQNAVVIGRLGGPARLLWCAATRSGRDASAIQSR